MPTTKPSRTRHTALCAARAAFLWFAVTLTASAGSAQPTPTVEPMPVELAVTPAPGRRRATAGGRAFCGLGLGVGSLRHSDLRATRLREHLALRRVAEGSGRLQFDPPHLAAVAALACHHYEDPNTGAWLSAYRQVLVNAFDLDDASIDALLGAATRQHGQRWEFACQNPRMPVAVTPPQQAVTDMRTILCSGVERGGLAASLTYWIDGGTGLERSTTPHADRAAFVGQLVRVARHSGIIPEVVVDPGSVEFIGQLLAYSDLEHIDVAGAARELAASGLGADERAFATAVVARIRVVALATKRAFDDALRADPALRRVFVEAPAAALRDYTAEASRHAEALRRAWDVEQAFLARDQAALARCTVPARRDLLGYLQGRTPASREQVMSAFDSPVGFALAAAVARCEFDDPTQASGAVRALGDPLARVAVQRGPRVAMLMAAARQSAIEAQANPAFAYQVLVDRFFGAIPSDYDWTSFGSTGVARSAQGVVLQAVPRGDVVRVQFRADIRQEPIWRCTPTNRIARIERDGTVRYHEDCVVVGQRPVDVAPEPIEIPAELASGVAVGVFLEAVAVGEGRRAYPLAVRPDHTAPEAVVLGVPLRR